MIHVILGQDCSLHLRNTALDLGSVNVPVEPIVEVHSDLVPLLVIKEHVSAGVLNSGAVVDGIVLVARRYD